MADRPPLRFVFGLHLHQPVGNFDHVFQQHFTDVYLPLLDTLEEAELLPAVLHLSGPLLDWLDEHEADYLDRIARLATAGRLELMLGGYYEPILASLPRADRVEQVRWMREAIAKRFGVEAGTLWLTERVWEPELAADLADAGVGAVLVDDRHFLVSGFARHQLHGWYRTESDGKGVGVFPIDERLRYLIPFRPPEETAAYLRSLHAAGHRLALLADDGEKFGGWPGTKEWVYEKGWFAQFGRAMRELVDEGVIVLSTLAEARGALPSSGLAYLPTASYREMEGWSLPPAPQLALGRLEHELGEERLAGPDGPLVRGSHWRNFMVKYCEANRLQKVMSALSREVRARGNPEVARRHVARAQCNDAYWHGVFGGLYLPHLRHALWDELALAERELRRRQPLSCEQLDLDGDGAEEVWIRSERISLVVAPARGGAIEVLFDLAKGKNIADALTRRREAYHEEALERAAQASAGDGDGAASIHDIEHSLRLDERPPVDPHDRALGVDVLLPHEATTEAIVAGTQEPIRSWAREQLETQVAVDEDLVTLTLAAPDRSLVKKIEVTARGQVTISWRWAPERGWFTSEFSFSDVPDAKPDRDAKLVRYPIETVSKSEKGLDRTVQGDSIVVVWDGMRAEGKVTLQV